MKSSPLPKPENITRLTPEKAEHAGHRQRLRTRLLSSGGNALADYEVLEMVLFAANPRGDTKPLAKKLLKHFGSLAKVLAADTPSLFALEVSEASVAAIKVTQEAGLRLLKEEAKSLPVLQSWNALLDYCRAAMGQNKIEQFRVLFLNKKYRLIADEVQQTGTIDHTPLYPREVIKRALELGASSIILVHNHPSGDPTPSKADLEMTNQVMCAAAPLGIVLYDHLVIAAQKFYSFKAQGLI